MAIDTRTKHYTATLQVNEVTSAGIVSENNYPKDGKTMPRDVEQVTQVTLRADSLDVLSEKLQDLLASGAVL